MFWRKTAKTARKTEGLKKDLKKNGGGMAKLSLVKMPLEELHELAEKKWGDSK